MSVKYFLRSPDRNTDIEIESVEFPNVIYNEHGMQRRPLNTDPGAGWVSGKEANSTLFKIFSVGFTSEKVAFEFKRLLVSSTRIPKITVVSFKNYGNSSLSKAIARAEDVYVIDFVPPPTETGLLRSYRAELSCLSGMLQI